MMNKIKKQVCRDGIRMFLYSNRSWATTNHSTRNIHHDVSVSTSSSTSTFISQQKLCTVITLTLNYEEKDLKFSKTKQNKIKINKYWWRVTSY